MIMDQDNFVFAAYRSTRGAIDNLAFRPLSNSTGLTAFIVAAFAALVAMIGFGAFSVEGVAINNSMGWFALYIAVAAFVAALMLFAPGWQDKSNVFIASTVVIGSAALIYNASGIGATTYNWAQPNALPIGLFLGGAALSAAFLRGTRQWVFMSLFAIALVAVVARSLMTAAGIAFVTPVEGKLDLNPTIIWLTSIVIGVAVVGGIAGTYNKMKGGFGNLISE